jgi:hypothetical protein
VGDKMQKLPEMYKNSNVQSPNKNVYYSFEKDNNDRHFSKEDIIFNDIVIIKTVDNTYETKIVSKLNDHILTSNKEIIYLKDIKSIKRKDHK